MVASSEIRPGRYHRNQLFYCLHYWMYYCISLLKDIVCRRDNAQRYGIAMQSCGTPCLWYGQVYLNMKWTLSSSHRPFSWRKQRFENFQTNLLITVLNLLINFSRCQVKSMLRRNASSSRKICSSSLSPSSVLYTSLTVDSSALRNTPSQSHSCPKRLFG